MGMAGSGGSFMSGPVMKAAEMAVKQGQAQQTAAQPLAPAPGSLANPDPGLPVYEKPNIDPMMKNLMSSAENAEIAALRDRAKLDTASLLARYGTRMAFSGIR